MLFMVLIIIKVGKKSSLNDFVYSIQYFLLIAFSDKRWSLANMFFHQKVNRNSKNRRFLKIFLKKIEFDTSKWWARWVYYDYGHILLSKEMIKIFLTWHLPSWPSGRHSSPRDGFKKNSKKEFFVEFFPKVNFVQNFIALNFCFHHYITLNNYLFTK